MMASNGALDKGGISQIRAHTTREIHKTRRNAGNVCSCHLSENGQTESRLGFDGDGTNPDTYTSGPRSTPFGRCLSYPGRITSQGFLTRSSTMVSSYPVLVLGLFASASFRGWSDLRPFARTFGHS
jgi:hypothetical protein